MGLYLLLLLPLVIGGIIAAINDSSVAVKIDSFTDWLTSRKSKITPESGKFSRFFIRPFLWAALQVNGFADGVKHDGMKSGIRVASYLYIIGLFLYLSMMLVALIVVMIIFAVIMLVVDFFDGSSGGRVVTRSVRKSRIFGGEYVETVDQSGKVVSTSEVKDRIFGGQYVETKDNSGKVVSTSESKERLFGDSYVETKDTEGRVVSTSESKERIFGGSYVETKDAEGNVIAVSEEKEGLFGDRRVETSTR
jgi:hypothetical protein